jgi:probable F420-dependent oxidoreductase
VDLGKIGVWTSQRAIGEENAAEAARFVEECGYGTFWLGSSPRLPSVRPLLEATEKIVVGTSIVNLWANEPEQLASEYAALAADFADRLVVGIGIGHPEATSDYAKPLTAMRAFLDGVDAADPPLPRGHRCLAALAPKMVRFPISSPSRTRAQHDSSSGPALCSRRRSPLCSTRIPNAAGSVRASTHASTSG